MKESTHERLAYKPTEVAQKLGLSEGATRKLIASGALRSVRSGRRVIVPASAIAEFLAGGAQ